MAGAINNSLQNFGRLFVRVETLIVVLISIIIIGIGAYAASKRDPRTGERNMYGFMFIGGGITFLVLFLIYASAVGGSDKMARLAGLGGLMRAL